MINNLSDKAFTDGMNANDGLDKLREECGVFGVYCTDLSKDAVLWHIMGCFALQHRGQESAGIAALQTQVGTKMPPTSERRPIECCKGMGLVGSVFSDEVLAQFTGSAAIGHVRYSAISSNSPESTQPFVSHLRIGSLAASLNGAMLNGDEVRLLLEDAGISFESTSDCEVILKLIAKNYKNGLEKALEDTIKRIKGSYALTLLTEDAMVGSRDPNGMKPLCLGKFDGGWVLASESCAIDAVGGSFVRDIEPGETVIIRQNTIESFTFCEKGRCAICSFEHVYFARPDSVIDSVDVYGARMKAGEILSKEAPVEADLVIGIPDSGVPAAIGYGRGAGIPFGLGVVKSKYVARSFIVPDEVLRERAVYVKHNVIESEVRGKRVIIIDDSIVRGITSRRLVALLKRSGAKEVHIRVVSPPVLYPCYFGVNTPHRRDLISITNSV